MRLPRYDSPPEYAASRPWERHRLWHLHIWAHDDAPEWWPDWFATVMQRVIGRAYCLLHGHADDSYGRCVYCRRAVAGGRGA